MSEDSRGRRLPPPAFPPGMRKHARRNHGPPDPIEAADPAPRDDAAYISPDEPLPPRLDPIGAAFISPDEPLPERKVELHPDFLGDVTQEAGEQGIVVGMDMEAHIHELEDAVSYSVDPHVADLAAAVVKLGEALRIHGEIGLRATPDMTRFEATLRAYCVGYLAGRRAGEPPPPVIADPLPTDG